MKEGDIGVQLRFTINKKNNVPVNLTEAHTYNLYYKIGEEGEIQVRPCVIIDAENGILQYVTEEGDLYTHGRMHMEVKLAFTNGDVLTTRTVKSRVFDAIRIPG